MKRMTAHLNNKEAGVLTLMNVRANEEKRFTTYPEPAATPRRFFLFLLPLSSQQFRRNAQKGLVVAPG